MSDLTYLYDTRANSTAFFQVSDGKRNYPAVFVYAGSLDAVDYVNRWSAARDEMYASGKPVFINLNVFVGFRTYASLVDGWHQYAPAQGYKLLDGYSAFISPGYWEYPELAIARNRTDPLSPLLPRDPATFALGISSMAQLTLAQAKFLLIATFNEFHEGTQIEPAFPINHDDTAQFSQAGSSYGFTFIDIVATRGKYVMYGMTGGGGGGVARRC